METRAWVRVWVINWASWRSIWHCTSSFRGKISPLFSLYTFGPSSLENSQRLASYQQPRLAKLLLTHTSNDSMAHTHKLIEFATWKFHQNVIEHILPNPPNVMPTEISPYTVHVSDLCNYQCLFPRRVPDLPPKREPGTVGNSRSHGTHTQQVYACVLQVLYM